MKPNVQLLRSQVDFVTSTTPRYIGFVAGFRGGKTYSFCHKAIYLASLNVGCGMDGALAEPTRDMNRRVLTPTMNTILEQIGLPYTYRGSDAPCYILHFPDGDFTIWLLSSENAESRARGLSLCFFGLDEFDTLKKQDAIDTFNIVASRLTNGKVMQVFFASTPEGYNFMHWFFVENPDDTKRLIRSSTEDNPFIDDGYCDELRLRYPPNLAQAYIDGEFVNLQTGSVYHYFDRSIHSTNMTIQDFFTPGKKPVLHIGCDFNVDNTTAVVSIIKNNIIYVVDEIVGCRDTVDMIKQIKMKYRGMPAIFVYPDSSGKNRTSSSSTAPTDIAYLKGAFGDGAVKYYTQNPRIKDRIAAVNGKLQNAKGQVSMYVNAEHAPTVMNALEQQAYDKHGKPDKTSGLDHCVDALGYFVTRVFPVNRKPTVKNI